MAQITSNIGIISGINTGAIVNGLISIDSEPVTLLQTQITSAKDQQQAYSSLETQLTAMQQIGQNLALPQTFQEATTNSSNPNVLTATAGIGAAIGSYQFQVAQLVSTQQSISNGFANTSSAPVVPALSRSKPAAARPIPKPRSPNSTAAPASPRANSESWTAAGNSTVINTSNDINLDDVISQINNATGISVHAAVTDNGLQITDQSGGTGTLSIQDLNGGTTAKNLGIAGAAPGNTLTGSDVNYISTATSLSQLNDGNGISTTTAGQTDFAVTVSDGSTINVSLNGATTVGDLLNDINTPGGSKLKASINSTGNGITLTDTSGGSGPFTLARPERLPSRLRPRPHRVRLR